MSAFEGEISGVSSETIGKIVRQVLAELGFDLNGLAPARSIPGRREHPKVLTVFQAGTRKMDEALVQTRMIEEMAAKFAVFTVESVRSRVCGGDIQEKTGARCILDNVGPDGMDKVLQHADILVLPTFCLTVAAKVSHLTCDDPDSRLLLSALMQGKKVLAAEDGFLVCNFLVNEALREEIKGILKKLERFGMMFCPTEKLAATFRQLMEEGTKDAFRGSEPAAPAFRLITAKDIHSAVNGKQTAVRLAPGGKVTPLARDLAKEYRIEILNAD